MVIRSICFPDNQWWGGWARARGRGLLSSVRPLFTVTQQLVKLLPRIVEEFYNMFSLVMFLGLLSGRPDVYSWSWCGPCACAFLSLKEGTLPVKKLSDNHYYNWFCWFFLLLLLHLYSALFHVYIFKAIYVYIYSFTIIAFWSSDMAIHLWLLLPHSRTPAFCWYCLETYIYSHLCAMRQLFVKYPA